MTTVSLQTAGQTDRTESACAQMWKVYAMNYDVFGKENASTHAADPLPLFYGNGAPKCAALIALALNLKTRRQSLDRTIVQQSG
jgi:hypothetical protein